MKCSLYLVFALVAGCAGSTPRANNPTARGLAAVTSSSVLAYRGVSLAGADFGIDAWGNGAIPGVFGTNYIWPDPTYVPGYTSQDYFIKKGMTVFRLPFRWEPLQPTRNQPFNTAELARLTTTVGHMTSKGASVILDPHNYARYGAALVGSSSVPYSDFADFWSRLATLFKGNNQVIFGLVNEPHDMPTEQWVTAANTAIAAIRATGATNLILVPGNGWDGASSWTSNWYGTPNSTAMLSIRDSGNNYAFEVHQYLNADQSGSDANCVSATIGSERLAAFTAWLKQNNKRGFLGEFAGGANATCSAAMDDILKHVEANSNVYLGWTYWAAGPWWGSYRFSLEPSATGQDAYQMAALLPHLAAPSPPPPPPAPTCVAGSYDTSIAAHSTGASTVSGKVTLTVTCP